MTLIPEILNTFLQNLLYSGNWGVVWFLVLLSLTQLKRKQIKVETWLILLSLLLFFGLYFAIALLTVNYVWIAGENSPMTLSRLLLHFYPLSAILIILLNYPNQSPQREL